MCPHGRHGQQNRADRLGRAGAGRGLASGSGPIPIAARNAAGVELQERQSG